MQKTVTLNSGSNHYRIKYDARDEVQALDALEDWKQRGIVNEPERNLLYFKICGRIPSEENV